MIQKILQKTTSCAVRTNAAMLIGLCAHKKWTARSFVLFCFSFCSHIFDQFSFSFLIMIFDFDFD
jgi:hypothetical protein